MDSRDIDRCASSGGRQRDVGGLVIVINVVVAGISGVFMATHSVVVAVVAAGASVLLVWLLAGLQ